MLDELAIIYRERVQIERQINRPIDVHNCPPDFSPMVGSFSDRAPCHILSWQGAGLILMSSWYPNPRRLSLLLLTEASHIWQHCCLPARRTHDQYLDDILLVSVLRFPLTVQRHAAAVETLNCQYEYNCLVVLAL